MCDDKRKILHYKSNKSNKKTNNKTKAVQSGFGSTSLCWVDTGGGYIEFESNYKSFLSIKTILS
jgi:hypothetical protein